MTNRPMEFYEIDVLKRSKKQLERQYRIAIKKFHKLGSNDIKAMRYQKQAHDLEVKLKAIDRELTYRQELSRD
jgi:hypothetical protein